MTKESAPRESSRKDAYAQQYQASKRGGLPFVPDVISHDALVALIVVGLIFLLAVLMPVVSAPPANPVGTAYSPRPEWYFIWVQTLLRLFPGKLEPVGAIILPLIVIVALFALPFFNRGLNRTFSARKWLVTIGVVAVAAVIVLEIYGILYPPKLAISSAPPPPAGANYGQVADLGKPAYDSSCASCHGLNGEGVIAPALWGPNARLSTYGTAQGLLQYVISTMPEGEAGILSHSTYVDILGYMLVRSGNVSPDTIWDESQLGNIQLQAAAPPTPPPSGATFGQLAQIGQQTYSARCASCHGANGQGGVGPAIWGANAHLSTYGTAKGLLDYLAANMPPGPTKLSHQEYLNTLAFILVQANDISAGDTFNESQLGSVALK